MWRSKMDESVLGHRQRLRERFLKAGVDGLQDYEILEMILFSAHPRGDVKPIAKQLLLQFKTIGHVFKASPEELKKIKGMGDASITILKMIEIATHRLLQEKIVERPILSSWNAVVEYCRLSMGYLKKEQVRLLFLDHHNQLISEDSQTLGTVDQVMLYKREVVEKALQAGASSIVIVHNHPSGDPTPSKQDIVLTQEIQKAVQTIGINLHDHLVIGHNKHVSMRSLGLL